MIFHENCLLADDSHELSYLFFLEIWKKNVAKIDVSAVVIGALRVNALHAGACPTDFFKKLI